MRILFVFIWGYILKKKKSEGKCYGGEKSLFFKFVGNILKTSFEGEFYGEKIKLFLVYKCSENIFTRKI